MDIAKESQVIQNNLDEADIAATSISISSKITDQKGNNGEPNGCDNLSQVSEESAFEEEDIVENSGLQQKDNN